MPHVKLLFCLLGLSSTVPQHNNKIQADVAWIKVACIETWKGLFLPLFQKKSINQSINKCVHRKPASLFAPFMSSQGVFLQHQKYSSLSAVPSLNIHHCTDHWRQGQWEHLDSYSCLYPLNSKPPYRWIKVCALSAHRMGQFRVNKIHISLSICIKIQF